MFVEVVCPEENCFTGDATMVISRTPNGEIGILDGHEQTVATLIPGGLTIEHDNTRTSFAISGGILQITGEKVIVCLLYTSPSPRDATLSRMPSSA